MTSKLPSSKTMQYFHRTDRTHLQMGSSSPFRTLNVIIFCILQLILPSCSANAAKSTNDRIVHMEEINTNYYNEDVDVVGYGEDCSSEGPFCDVSRHLTCDPIDETCICDAKKGYMHINDVPGGLEEHLLIQNDEDGNPYLDPYGNVCINQQEIIERTEQVLALSKQREESLLQAQAEAQLEDYREGNAEKLIKDKDQNDILPTPQTMNGRTEEDDSIYNKFMKIAKAFEQPDYDEERLERFKLYGKLQNVYKTEKELIIEEISKYRRGPISLDELQSFIKNLLDLQYAWRRHKLSNSVCSLIFDVDRDQVFTHEEYVIASLSENIRQLVIPKVFFNLIGPLIEESCISMEDLRVLEHDPETLLVDFYVLDANLDGCISEDEFSKYANETCWVNWLTDFLKETELNIFLEIIDPSPEEMYIRKLMQNERMSINWKIIDNDNDGFISYDELYSDLTPFGFSPESIKKDTNALMMHLDKNNDGKASFDEVKLQIVMPELTEDYQLEWLESMYELYETDEEEVKEYLDYFNEQFGKPVGEENLDTFKGTKDKDRVFNIFDRNRNGEMDKVEFKLLMEMLKKYIVHDLLNDTVDSMDMNSDRKISIFEYQEFFKNSSATFRIYFRNLLALEDEIDEIENGVDNRGGNSNDDDSYADTAEYQETDEGEDETSVSSTKLSRRAAASNVTAMVNKLFRRMDSNTDGFLTKEDFYFYASSFKSKKSVSELKEEFMQMDLNKDGILSTEDAEDYIIPIDFEKFKETAEAFSEEVFPSHLKSQFPLLDRNKNDIIEKEEFQVYKVVLFSSDEEQTFLEWIEDYLTKVPIQMDEASEKAFAEFDKNCDRFISKTEFMTKFEELRKESEKIDDILKLQEDTSIYFKILDLNHDEKVSHNEFLLLLLRTGEKVYDKQGIFLTQVAV